jgi:hypothetical protein
MAGDATCYLCDEPIDREAAVVTIPRLALRLHLSCYERDLGLTPAPSRRAPRVEGLARALGRPRPRGA